MQKFQYRITVDYLADNQGNTMNNQSLIFHAPNHDNLFELLEKVKQKHPNKDEETLSRFMIGLKTLSEVVLENRDDEFFGQFSPIIKELMMTVKGKQ